MSKSLPPSLRRQIIAFDPVAPDGPSVTEFCRSLGISRPSFYNVRARFLTEGNSALNPHSRAPKQPRRVYDQDTAETVLRIRKQLERSGWDAGPKSIRFAGIDTGEFPAGAVPSVSTIARVLADAGVVKPNRRKRPRSSYIRFHRAAAMEMWQLDAFEYKLHDAGHTLITVYQLVDDSTRFDVGTTAFADPENGVDAIAAVTGAIQAHGVPQELLSDNGGAFNLSRQGMVAALERFLADVGCLAISGQFRKPTTQGKNERSHQTLQRHLDAHAPTSLEQVRKLIGGYRQYYNHRRRHQGLPGDMTPAQAWTAAEHRPSDGTPIPHADLEARALAYRDRTAVGAGADEGPPVADPQHTASGRLREAPEEITVNRQNPQIYLHGKILKVPTHLVGSYSLVITDTEYMLFDITDGAESIGFPLPITTQATGRMLPLWKVKGARIRGPKPGWTAKHLAYEAEHYPGP